MTRDEQHGWGGLKDMTQTQDLMNMSVDERVERMGLPKSIRLEVNR